MKRALFLRIAYSISMAAVIAVLAIVQSDTAVAASTVSTYENGAGTAPDNDTWIENGIVTVQLNPIHSLRLFDYFLGGQDGDREVQVFDLDGDGPKGDLIEITKQDGSAFSFQSVFLQGLVGHSTLCEHPMYTFQSSAGGLAGYELYGELTLEFHGAEWNNVTWVKVWIEATYGATPATNCGGTIDDVTLGDPGEELGPGSKADVLTGSGVPGKGLEDAPGQQKEFNEKSNASENAGKKD